MLQKANISGEENTHSAIGTLKISRFMAREIIIWTYSKEKISAATVKVIFCYGNLCPRRWIAWNAHWNKNIFNGPLWNHCECMLRDITLILFFFFFRQMGQSILTDWISVNIYNYAETVYPLGFIMQVAKMSLILLTWFICRYIQNVRLKLKIKKKY